MNKATNLVNHTYKVRLALTETLSRLKDAETGSRGFIISKDSAFLDNFLSSEQDLNDHLNRLALLARDNPAQVKQTDTLKTLVHKRLDLIQSAIWKFGQKEISAQGLRAELLRGKQAMDDVRSRLLIMEKIELQLLEKRTAKSKQYIVTTPWFVILLTVTALLIILYAFYRLNIQLKRSNRHGMLAEKEAEKAYTLLENAEQIAGVASWEWNRTTNSINRSNNLYRLYGYEPGSFDPDMVNFLCPMDEQDRDGLLNQLTHCSNKGVTSCTYNYWARHKDVTRRYFQCISKFNQNEAGQKIITGTIRDITEEHLLAQKAQQRAYLTEQVVEHNIDLILMLDSELRVQIWNKAYEEAFGVPRDLILGKKLTDVFPYIENDIKITLTKAALEGKETIRKELTFLKDQRIGEISFIPLRDIHGNIEGVLIIIHDITELKIALEQLKDSNLRFEQAEEAGKLGSYKRNTRTGEGTVSKNLYKIFGIEPSNATPYMELFLELVHPEDKLWVIDSIDKNSRTDLIDPVRCRIIRKDGETRYIKASAIPVVNGGGETIIYGSISDITEEELLKQEIEKANIELQTRNKALQEANAINRHINDLAPNGIFVYDQNLSTTIYVNKKMKDLHGYSEIELNEMGSNFLVHLVHPDDLPQLYKSLELFETATDEDVVVLEYRMRHKDGKYRNIICREAIFKRNESREPIQFIGVAIDITEIKMAEKELKEKNLELLQSNEELATFNYVASHDLQEPLRKIQTFCDFLQQTEKGLSEQGINSLHRMQFSASRMRTLINDLLSFSRIDMMDEGMEAVDLNNILQHAISRLKKHQDDKGLHVIVDELPNVMGISFLLEQLFENIIGNAIKYSGEDKEPEVHISCIKVSASQLELYGLNPEQEYYKLSFRDNGIGFEQQYADKIFELFQRLHSQSEYQGTGLGLAICKKIVLKHGGIIKAKSQPGAGSVFEIFLPCL